MTPNTSKNIRRQVYQWAAKNGVTMTKKRHQELKNILLGKFEEEEAEAAFMGDDEDTNLLPPEEE
jgi:hypothetical protein